MLSRRAFLLAWLGGTATAFDLLHSAPAFARRAPRGLPTMGPHEVSRQMWPPAILPDHVALTDRGLLLFTDEFGRLAIVDLKKANATTPARIVSELGGLGKRVIDFAVAPGIGYGLVLKETEAQDTQLSLVTVSLNPAEHPEIMAYHPLEKFTEVTALTASADALCIGGSSGSGENLVAIYTPISKRAGATPQFLSAVSFPYSIAALSLQDRHLAVLSSNGRTASQFDFVKLINPRIPEQLKSIQLDGDFKILARQKERVLVAGSNGSGKSQGSCEARTIVLGQMPHAVATMTLDPMTTVLGASAQRDRFVIIGEASGERVVLPLAVDKLHSLIREQVVTLPKANFGPKASILVKDKSVYIASGWAGVMCYSNTRTGWQPTYTYSIPRLPASSIAQWGDLVVLAGADLRLYSIAQPEKPNLVTQTDLSTSVRAMVGAGSYVLCLTKDSILLRKMDKLQETITSSKIAANQLCFDAGQQRAYLLKTGEKTSTLFKYKIYSNSIEMEKKYDLPGNYARVRSQGGYALLSGLNDIGLYKLADSAELVGTRHFENLAIRDLCLADDYVVATAVDQNSKGFFLVLAKNQSDLRVSGSIDLPHDGVALAAAGGRAVVVGKGQDGKDIASIINFTNPVAPQVSANIPVVESASAVSIKEQLAIVAGRGIDIISLS